MGTRAMIRIDGKDFVATHWDGHPETLGKELVSLPVKNKKTILSVAKKHNIDSASAEIHSKLNKERIESISKNQKLSASEVKKGIRRGDIIAIEDYEVGFIKNYGDFAEYIYDVRDNSVYVAEGHGDYDATKKAEKEGKLKWKRYVGGKSGTLTKPLLKKEKGWFSESARHSLASKGIKTGRKR